MNQSSWVKRFFTITILTIILVSLVNYIVNPFSVFDHHLDTAFSKKTNIFSDRMSKFYVANHLKPTTILIGTSRSGLFSEKQLSPYAESPIYNYSMFGSSVDEQAAYIQYMITHHKLKTVVWSLDFFSFNPTKPIESSFEPKRLKDSIYWKDYLFSLFSFKTLGRSFTTVKSNLSSNAEDAPKDQPYTPQEVDFNINYTLHQYATEKSFLASEAFKDPASINAKLSLVRKTISLCQQQNVQCLLYTSPVYHRHIDMIYSIGLGKTFEAWKIGIAKSAPYTDFCNDNTITKNKMNFRDSSHVIPSIGKLVSARIFEDKNVIIPNDFGHLVTPENITFHINRDREMRTPFSFDSIIY